MTKYIKIVLWGVALRLSYIYIYIYIYISRMHGAKRLMKNAYNSTNKYINVKIIFLTHNPSGLRHVSIYLD